MSCAALSTHAATAGCSVGLVAYHLPLRPNPAPRCKNVILVTPSGCQCSVVHSLSADIVSFCANAASHAKVS